MSKNTITALALGLCAAAVGLALILPSLGSPSPPPPGPPPEPAVVCETWQQSLADRIGKTIKESDELTQVLLELHKAGNMTDQQFAEVNDKLPDLVHKNRALTEADAEKIRSVK